MKLGRNFLAALANSVWTALVGLAVIPLYLRFLGIEAYGLIGFFATAQALLQILDLVLAPTIHAFFAWQACVGLVYAATMRWAAWRVVGRTAEVQFDSNQLKRVWRFSMGMSVIALSSLVFTQLDKVLLSKILGLEEFGRYMLATVVVSALYVLVAPAFNAIYPRFSALVASGTTEKLA